MIVVGLVSAAQESQSEIPVFGGAYDAVSASENYPHTGPNKPTHACPGRRMAMGVLGGVIAAFLEQPGTLRPTPSDLVLSLKHRPRQNNEEEATGASAPIEDGPNASAP